MTETIVHNRAAQRFEVQAGSALALCDYRLQGKTATFHHTQVPQALQGRGIAGELVAHALQWARTEGLAVRPSCSYVAAYIRRHPEFADLLVE